MGKRRRVTQAPETRRLKRHYPTDDVSRDFHGLKARRGMPEHRTPLLLTCMPSKQKIGAKTSDTVDRPRARSSLAAANTLSLSESELSDASTYQTPMSSSQGIKRQKSGESTPSTKIQKAEKKKRKRRERRVKYFFCFVQTLPLTSTCASAQLPFTLP